MARKTLSQLRKHNFRSDIKDYGSLCSARANELKGQIERSDILLVKATRLREKAQELIEKAKQLESRYDEVTTNKEESLREVKRLRTQSAACKNILSLKGEKAALLTSFPPQRAVILWLAIWQGKEEIVERMVSEHFGGDK